MITDRARAGGDAAAVVARVAAAAQAGVHLVQVRERGLAPAALSSLVSQCLEAVRATRTRVIVNHHLEVALAVGAHGVHLPADAMRAADARLKAPAGFLIGRSVHATGEARAAAAGGGLDYLMFGTVFDTASKPGIAGVGAEALARTVAAVHLPVLAIGGMTAQTVAMAAAAGAAGFAAIGLFADPPLDRLQLSVRQASRAFDTPGSVP